MNAEQRASRNQARGLSALCAACAGAHEGHEAGVHARYRRAKETKLEAATREERREVGDAHCTEETGELAPRGSGGGTGRPVHGAERGNDVGDTELWEHLNETRADSGAREEASRTCVRVAEPRHRRGGVARGGPAHAQRRSGRRGRGGGGGGA